MAYLPPADLPSPGIKPESLMSPALAGIFSTTAPSGRRVVQKAPEPIGQKNPGGYGLSPFITMILDVVFDGRRGISFHS